MTELIPRATVRELVTTYDAAVESIKRFFDGMAAMDTRVHAAYGRGCTLTPRLGHYYDADTAVEQLTRDCWLALLEKIELRRFVSLRAWDRLQTEIRTDSMPTITVESVASVFSNLAGQMDDLMVEKVREVYDFMRPRNGKYKTNDPNAGARARVILPWTVTWAHGRFTIYEPHTKMRLSTIESVLRGFDGKGHTTNGYESDLLVAIVANPSGVGETEYFRFRAYANRSLHLTWKRLDLLARLNEIAGKGTLRT
jgi:hypothetical protein